MDWLYRLCRWTLGAICIYAGGTKLLEPKIFALLIEGHGIVPEGLLIPVAIGLPLLEVIAGFGLLFDSWRDLCLEGRKISGEAGRIVKQYDYEPFNLMAR